MLSAMKVLVVCHAGPGIGLGHLSRCLVAARYLRNLLRATVSILIQGDPVSRPDLQCFEHDFVPLSEDLVARINEKCPCDFVLLDLQPSRVPDRLGDGLVSWRDMGTKVVAIDGLLAHRDQLDLIFIPAFKFDLPADMADGAPIVFGWDCYLMSPPEKQSEWCAGRNLLVLTGGSDATGLGATWPTELNDRLPADVELHWVTGPYAAEPIWPSNKRVNVVEHQAPAGLSPLMAKANYAITVFGVSLFELLSMGIPTVVFSPYGQKDRADLQAIEQAGVALVAQDESHATQLLIDLLSNQELARQLSSRALALLSISGGVRLCSEIARLQGDHGR